MNQLFFILSITSFVSASLWAQDLPPAGGAQGSSHQTTSTFSAFYDNGLPKPKKVDDSRALRIGEPQGQGGVVTRLGDSELNGTWDNIPRKPYVDARFSFDDAQMKQVENILGADLSAKIYEVESQMQRHSVDHPRSITPDRIHSKNTEFGRNFRINRDKIPKEYHIPGLLNDPKNLKAGDLSSHFLPLSEYPEDLRKRVLSVAEELREKMASLGSEERLAVKKWFKLGRHEAHFRFSPADSSHWLRTKYFPFVLESTQPTVRAAKRVARGARWVGRTAAIATVLAPLSYAAEGYAYVNENNVPDEDFSVGLSASPSEFKAGSRTDSSELLVKPLQHK